MDYQTRRRGIIYGPPKSGKSEKLARLPKGSTAFIVDADRQLGSFMVLWKKIQGSFKGLEIVRLEECVDETESEKRKTFRSVRSALWSPPKGFDFYFIDSYTKITMLLTHAICGKGERKYNQFNNQQLSSAANDFWQQFVGRIEHHTPEAWVWTIMHEQWKELDDGVTEAKDRKSIIIPKCGTSAEVAIPGSCDFVWHVEKGRTFVGGRTSSESFYRTRGTSTIMASSVGFDKILKDEEVADLGKLIEKMGLKKKKGGAVKRSSSRKSTTKKKGRSF
jgi:hypothetical protein